MKGNDKDSEDKLGLQGLKSWECGDGCTRWQESESGRVVGSTGT